MGFKYNKRINLGKGLGLNLSKSGISTSYRSKLGSISPKGYSIKTGIPGLSYRKSFTKSSGCIVLMALILCTCSLTVLACTSLTDEDTTGCVKANCNEFNSQAAAQAAFNANPSCYKNLDRDNDGIACEQLKK